MPETSVVIRSFNEADLIGDVLAAVGNQDYRNFELILVDSGSTDGTLEIADPYVDEIEFVPPRDFTFGYSCNVGCRAASGRFVSFLSAHAIPTDRAWLGTLVETLRKDEDVAMTYGKQIGTEDTKFSERRLFRQLFPDEWKYQTPPDYFANNASSAIRRSLWEDHPFDIHLTGHEDIEWAKHFMEEGYAVVYEPEACVNHVHDETWNQVYNRFKREAVADVEIGVRSPIERWTEYLDIPRDILADTVAALRDGEFDRRTLVEIARFRYYQHTGTASGLGSDPDIDSNRYEFFYPDVNENVVITADGTAELRESPLPEIKPNEVLIQTMYVLVSAGHQDGHGYEPVQYPIVPGDGFVGTVAKLGARANGVEVGDVVAGPAEFPCGLCSSCHADDTQECEDPVRLGVDTAEGPYARFFAVPSDHVHQLGREIEPIEGVLAAKIATLVRPIEHAETISEGGSAWAVIGDTQLATLSRELLEHSGTSDKEVDQIRSVLEDGSDLDTYDVIIETTGNRAEAQAAIDGASPAAVLLLLGADYGELNLLPDTLQEKTISHGGRRQAWEVDEGVELLAAIDAEEVLDGQYPLEDFRAAWREAEDSSEFPVIALGE